MSKRLTKKVWLILAAMAILVGLSSAPAAATLSMMQTYRTGIDVGNDPATGCDFSLGSVAPNSLPGFELQVTVVVDADLMPPQVVSAEVETCSGDGGSFGGAQPLPGFVLEIDTGLLGSDSVVGAIPLSLLGDAVVVRLAHHALSGVGSEDALFTRDGTPDGAAITALLPQPAPAPLLSGLGVALAVLLLFGIGFTQWRRGGWGAAAVLVFVASGAVIAYAAFGDPAAVDDAADATPPDTRAEIVASFVMATDSELGLRLDIEDIDADCSDGVQNQDETDVDCGGSTCSACPDGSGCSGGSDCTSGICTGSTCQHPLCAGKVDGTTCDAGTDGTVLTCESGACGACVPMASPSPRYVDNGDGTITDRSTCLVWEKKDDAGGIHDKDDRYTWCANVAPMDLDCDGGMDSFDGTAKTAFLDVLNDVTGDGTSCFAGHCDWRLPSEEGQNSPGTGPKELESILAEPSPCAVGPPCVDAVFNINCTAGCSATEAPCSCTASDFYWSSSTFPASLNDAWLVWFDKGNVTFTDKGSDSAVRAVRGGS